MKTTLSFNQWYTDQYNTRRNLPPGAVDDILLHQWPARSDTVRQTVPCMLNLPYGKHAREIIDIFPASGSRKWVAFIHGGYWKAMHGSASSFIVPPLTAAGYNVAIPSYRLCPDVTIGAIIDECAQAIAWLAHNADKHSDGCDEIIVAGHSAGGHLAATMFTVDWARHDVPASIFTGGIGLSGLYDLDPIRQCEMNAVLGLSPADVQLWSPARLVPTVDAPLLVAAGDAESGEFHRQMDVLAGAPGWGATVRNIVSVPGRNHFDLLDDFLDVGGALWGGLNG